MKFQDLKLTVPFPEKLLLASHYMKKDGTKIKLNHNIKSIYVYIYSRYSYYKRIGKNYFQSQANIGKSLGLAKNTVASSLETLVDMELYRLEKLSYRRYVIHCKPLDDLDGYLINDNFDKIHENEDQIDYQVDELSDEEKLILYQNKKRIRALEQEIRDIRGDMIKPSTVRFKLLSAKEFKLNIDNTNQE